MAICLAGACLVGGCQAGPGEADAAIGAEVDPAVLDRTPRVVFVELVEENNCPPDVAWSTTRALAHAIQRRGLFHVNIVRHDDPRCRDLPLRRIEALTVEQLAEMRKSLRCDAVLFGRATHFQPFPRMQLGLLLKLVDLKDGRLGWGIDHVWDTTDHATERRIKRYFHREVRSGYEPLGWELVLKSPRAFERFVAYEAAGTLPLPAAPAPAGAGASGQRR